MPRVAAKVVAFILFFLQRCDPEHAEGVTSAWHHRQGRTYADVIWWLLCRP